MASLRERIAAIDERSRNNDKAFNRALIRAGAIIISGYLIGTVIGLILRYLR